MDDYRDANRANWDQRAPAHVASPDYNVQAFIDNVWGEPSLPAAHLASPLRDDRGSLLVAEHLAMANNCRESVAARWSAVHP